MSTDPDEMMRVQISIVGEHSRQSFDWPEGWPIPRVDEEIDLPFGTVFVRTVVWTPLGDESTGPHVYVVLGERRR